MVASSANVEFRADAPGPEKRGAGGKGLRGLPPYLEEGVPGLGLPFKSTGSKFRFEGGGRVNSLDPPRDGLQERVGEALPLAAYVVYELSGGGIAGAPSMIDGARECEEVTVG